MNHFFDHRVQATCEHETFHRRRDENHLDHGREDSDSAKDGHNWSDVQELLCQTVCVCVCVCCSIILLQLSGQWSNLSTTS